MVSTEHILNNVRTEQIRLRNVCMSIYACMYTHIYIYACNKNEKEVMKHGGLIWESVDGRKGEM